MDYLKKAFNGLFGNDIGIDLGTANTLVYVRGKGILINEPSVVAVNEKTGQVVAVGVEARNMIGRTPPHIKAIRPLQDGVISDFEVAEEMLAYFIDKAQGDGRRLFGPRVVIGIPSGITNVESRAVRDAAINAGAREVHIVEEPMAGAIGAKLPIRDPVGTMVIDIGGGTTDIAMISLGGIVASKQSTIAGDTFNRDIVDYIRDEFKMIIGDKTAEDLKVKVTSLVPTEEALSMTVRGRDILTGLPREVVITDTHIRSALGPSIESLMEVIREVVEVTPPEVLGDIMQRGAYVFGGGACVRGLPKMLQSVLGVPVHVVEEPLTAVVRGTGIITENVKEYKDIVLAHEEDLAPKT
ncbi:MAG: rod shape-determining protein [Patescibacteria group bacterium UBA2103]